MSPQEPSFEQVTRAPFEKAKPVALKSNILIKGQARFTLLTSRLIRCEWAPNQAFDDRPTQLAWHRQFPEVSRIEKVDEKGWLQIETAHLILRYLPDGKSFRKGNLEITLKDEKSSWFPGAKSAGNLLGTSRTLDTCDGGFVVSENKAIELQPGLLSREGWHVIDDSTSMAFDEKGWLTPRNQPEGYRDLYFFGYGYAYTETLRDYRVLTGAIPLPPKWALGVWWSRWEKYTSADLEKIVADFETHQVPLSVLVVDMDWHLEGWTGYTWNKDFFPDPEGFFKRIHAKDIHACLNLHPSAGVQSHEAAYEAMARHMGKNPADKATIPFDINDPRYMEGYFKHLHHPLEKQGVDFWWIDWQQGTQSGVEELDPLWALNHLHSLDLARDGKRRPFILSRWCEPGGHRYPLQMAGDTFRTWDTLRFAVYFTVNAANVGGGWWAHDIGGFSRGKVDDELWLRFTQFGSLSPIMRFHNCGDPTLDYLPWSKEPKFRDPALDILRLRRRLVPYIYTAAWRNHMGGQSLCVPLFHLHPREEMAYWVDHEYAFGPDLLVSHYSHPIDPETNHSRQAMWFPEGTWYDFTSGKKIPGDRWHAFYGELKDTLIFAKEGATLPLATDEKNHLELVLFPGDGTSHYYDDDGESLDYAQGDYRLVEFQQQFKGRKLSLTIRHAEGNLKSELHVSFRLRGMQETALSSVTWEGKKLDSHWEGNDLVLSRVQFSSEGRLEINFSEEPKAHDRLTREEFKAFVRRLGFNPHPFRQIAEALDKAWEDPSALKPFMTDMTPAQLRAMIEVWGDLGFHVRTLPDGTDLLVWWNVSKNPSFRLQLSRREEYTYWSIDTAHPGQMQGKQHHDKKSYPHWNEDGTGFAILTGKSGFSQWQVWADYLGLTTVAQSKKTPYN